MATIIDLNSRRNEDEQGEICPACSIELEQLATDLFMCPSCNHVIAITEGACRVPDIGRTQSNYQRGCKMSATSNGMGFFNLQNTDDRLVKKYEPLLAQLAGAIGEAAGSGEGEAVKFIILHLEIIEAMGFQLLGSMGVDLVKFRDDIEKSVARYLEKR